MAIMNLQHPTYKYTTGALDDVEQGAALMIHEICAHAIVDGEPQHHEDVDLLKEYLGWDKLYKPQLITHEDAEKLVAENYSGVRPGLVNDKGLAVRADIGERRVEQAKENAALAEKAVAKIAESDDALAQLMRKTLTSRTEKIADDAKFDPRSLGALKAGERLSSDELADAIKRGRSREQVEIVERAR